MINILKKQKLTISFALIILIFIFFGVFTIKGLYALGNFTTKIYEHPLVVSNASLYAALEITKMQRSMKDVFLAGSPEEIESALTAVNEDEQEVYQQLDIIRKDILGDEGKILEQQTRQLFVNWKPIREEVVRLLKSGNKKGAIFITKDKDAQHVATLETKMLQLSSYARKKADTFIDLAESMQSRLEAITIFITFLGVILSLIIAFIAIQLVSKSEKLLRDQNRKLQASLDEIKILQGILPICSFCKNVRNDEGYYEQIEEYIRKHSDVDFSHTVCPSCMKKHYPAEYNEIILKKNKKQIEIC